MGLFGRNIKKVIRELKKISEYYSNDLSREINESFEDLKSDYDESSLAVPEFSEMVKDLKHKLDSADVAKLEAFSARLLRLNQSARKGVEAMHELSRNQRKLTSESLRYYEEYEY
ncbi:MAG TPA: hypothetical protein VF676_01735 [Flavobacterium sp.]|jgi:DNA repair ATPase RecN